MDSFSDYEDAFSAFKQMALMKNSTEDQNKLRTIIDEIVKYDVFDFIARLSALNLLIENQNKSILFDVLVAGILSRERNDYSGVAKMSSGGFSAIITRLNQFCISQMIDPAENPFIERVRYYGNYWIFPGINYSPAYCLQSFLDVLCLRSVEFHPEFTKKAHQLINFILYISDMISKKLNYNIDTIERVEVEQIKIPDASQMEVLKSCVKFPFAVIKSMIEDASLHSVLFSDFSESDLNSIVINDCQNFFAHPFLKANDDTVVILNPSILVSFLIHQLVVLSDYYGIKKQWIDEYNNEVWKKCQESLKKLGHLKIKESEYAIELINDECRKEKILSVGNDKLLFVHFVCDSGEDYCDNSLFGSARQKNDDLTTYTRMQYFTSQLPLASKDNTYQIVILNSFGRRIYSDACADEIERTISLSPFELQCISINENKRNNFIPKYIDAKQNAFSFFPPMLASELNYIALYTDYDYSFYFSDEYSSNNTFMYCGIGNSLDYVIKAIKAEDRHLIEWHDNIHLAEIELSDPLRKIYTKISKHREIPECVVKFEKINIWITCEQIRCREEAEIYFALSDAISYWLAECKQVINSMEFCDTTLCIRIKMTPPFSDYFGLPEENDSIENYLKYEHSDMNIELICSAKAYCLLGGETNSIERDMIFSLIQEIEKQSLQCADWRSIENVFSDPIKKKFYKIDANKSPHLLPINRNSPVISAEEENKLLDEIGRHFLNLPEYDYGIVPDNQRASLANKVVGYLYSLLQAEVASIKSEGVYETVCLDLETVMFCIMRTHSRYAYDMACYPEHADQLFIQYNETNKASVALKFLAEYIAAVPPSGEKVLGLIQYERILAICSLIVDWAYRNDLFYYHIFSTPITFLKSGRIGMKRDESNYLLSINVSARTSKLHHLSNHMLEMYSPISLLSEYDETLDEAFLDEYGYSFQCFLQCIFALSSIGDEIKGEVKRKPRSIVENEIVKRTSISYEKVTKILDQISLSQRSDFLTPPKPYGKLDVYPWRFNRELSFTRRPIIQYGTDLIWGNRQLHHMWRYTLDLIVEGKYKARKDKLKNLIGELSDKRGNEFNSLVARKLESIDGLIVREKLSKINGKKILDSDGNVLGDIDVFYIVPEKYKIVVGEVKDFSFAKNPYEMDQEYKRIFVDGDHPCYMTKHKRRAKWVKEHIDDVIAHFALQSGDWSVTEVMFTSEAIVSNAFYHQNERIITYTEIDEHKVKDV